jgi:hypothetical protein
MAKVQETIIKKTIAEKGDIFAVISQEGEEEKYLILAWNAKGNFFFTNLVSGELELPGKDLAKSVDEAIESYQADIGLAQLVRITKITLEA